MKRRFLAFVLITAMLFSLGIPVVRADGDDPDPDPAAENFTVQGSKILDLEGNELLLKGVNVNGPGWCFSRGTMQDVSLIVDTWKFNSVRLCAATKWDSWAQGYNNNDIDNFDTLIEAFTSRGIIVMIESHDYTGIWPPLADDGGYTTGAGDIIRPLKDLKSWWVNLANLYKDNPYVWFNIMNEPGASDSQSDAELWLSIHDEVIEAIRATGAENIIVLDDHNWGQASGYMDRGAGYDSAVIRMGPTLNAKYDNLVYSLHVYDAWRDGKARFDAYFADAEALGLCVILGEYGVGTNSLGQHNAVMNMLNSAIENEIGRFYWAWDDNGLPMTTSGGNRGWSVNQTDGTKPTNLTWAGEMVWLDNHGELTSPVPRYNLNLPLLTNGNFNSNMNGWSNWGSCSVPSSTTNSYNSTRFLQIAAGNSGGCGRDVELKPGTTYRVSAVGYGVADLGIKYNYAIEGVNDGLEYEYHNFINFNSPTSWEQKFITFTTPDDLESSMGTLFIWKNGTDVFRIDDVELYEVIVSDIAVNTPPTKTFYQLGEELDISGLTLDVNYTDRDPDLLVVRGLKPIDGNNDGLVEVSGFDSTTGGVKTVTVLYNNRTTTFDVEVEDPTPVKPNVQYEQINLGAPVIDGDLRTWRTNGMDGLSASLEMTTLKLATQLVVEFAARPSSNFLFILASETNGWWQEISIARPSGTTLTIDLPQANTWGDFIKADTGKFSLAQWGANLQVSGAYLLVPKLVVVDKLPTKLTYAYGEEIDLTGMVMWVYDSALDDYVLADIANATTVGYDKFAFGEQNVNVIYTYSSVDYKAPITVLVEPPEGGIAVSISAVDGVAPPRFGATPTAAVTETSNFTGTVTWDLEGDVFGKYTIYTATITLTPKYGYTLEGVPANFFKVAGATSVTNDAESGVITAVFPATKDEINKTEMRDITAAEIVAEMNIGWNLGNTFDATGNGNAETAWVNILTTKAMIDKIADAGFNILRLPITWTTGGGAYARVGNAASGYLVSATFLDRIEEVVNWGLDNGMYVIINMHHENWMTQMTTNNYNNNNARVAAIWTQVAARFKDYGDHLIFETMNEPRNGDDWTGTQSNYNVVNNYNTLIVNAIRATGGNNEKRFVMFPGYAAASGVTQMTASNVPNDMYPNKLIASVHSYSPYNFALNTDNAYNQWGTAADKQELKQLFTDINRVFTAKGVPVVLGEFGAMNKNNELLRAEWAKYFISGARQYGIPCVWWDNNAFTSGERFGLLDRGTLTFPYPHLLAGLMEGLVFKIPMDLTLNPVYNTAEGKWQLAAVLKNIDRTNKIYSGSVDLVAPVGYTTVDTLDFEELAYGEEAVLYFDINPAYSFDSAQVTIQMNYEATDGENIYTGEDPALVKFGLVSAAKSSDPITVNGDLSEFSWESNTEIIDFAKGVIDGNGTLGSTLNPEDLSATGKLAWDNEYLYMALTVNDSIHYQNQTGGEIWQGDGIQVSAGDTAGVREMGFAINGAGTISQYCWTNSTTSTAGTGSISANDASSAIIRDEDSKTTVYEVAIKWSYLGMDGNNLSIGDIAKISITINDNDNTSDGRKFIEYGEGIAVGPKGSNMGYLVLLPGAEKPEVTARPKLIESFYVIPSEVTGTLEDGEITFTWVDPNNADSAIESYELYATNGGNKWLDTPVIIDAANTTVSEGVTSAIVSFADLGITKTGEYDFRIKAANDKGAAPFVYLGGEFRYKVHVTVEVLVPTAKPKLITNFEAVLNDESITFSWINPNPEKSATSVESYSLYKTSGGSVWLEDAIIIDASEVTVDEGITSITLTFEALGIVKSGNYDFRIKATNIILAASYVYLGGENRYKVNVEMEALIPVAKPKAVTDFNATANEDSITFTWVNPNGISTLVDSYELYRTTTGNTWQLPIYIDASDVTVDEGISSVTVTFEQLGIDKSGSYDFRIKGINGFGVSALTYLGGSVSSDPGRYRLDVVYTAPAAPIDEPTEAA